MALAFNFTWLFMLIPLAIKIAIAIWIYKDAKSRGKDSILWILLVMFTSSILVLLLYLIIEGEDTITCPYCGHVQSRNLSYCGSCGKKIDIEDSDVKSRSSDRKSVYLVIFLICLAGLLSFLIMNIVILKG
ncbi:hypothetical protein [Peptoniphilus catoniae]|uniref:hypothetical protein n=1 Tax=Peptoniphilus catoniae TaxID=1660341 RepID=UPI0010FEB1DD|nr:hypothetical protein [Peptoniphilus catoniae]